MVAFETLVFADDRDVLGLIDVDKSASHHVSQTEIDGDNPLFSTSLTKSASSRVFSSFFIPFAHTPTVAQSRFFSGRCAAILGLFFPVQPTGSVRVTSSTRCCPPDISPITCDHDDFFELPDNCGRRVAYSLDPVTALQDHCCDQASPHGHYRFPAALFLDGRTLGNQSGHAS